MKPTTFSHDTHPSSSSTFLTFIEEWDNYYAKQVETIPLFHAANTAQWTPAQKAHFVKVFYHCRGHFHELMWFIASYAPDKKSKDIILENMAEEMGEHGFSHEQLYSFVAEAVGVDITKEYIDHETYLPFCKAFNRGHLQWLKAHDWTGKIAAFGALERLDNVDYINGKALAENLGLTGKALTFFNVHIHVDHFGSVVRGALQDLWPTNADKVKEAFYFIADHQIKMWKELSNEIFSYRNEEILSDKPH